MINPSLVLHHVSFFSAIFFVAGSTAGTSREPLEWRGRVERSSRRGVLGVDVLLERSPEMLVNVGFTYNVGPPSCKLVYKPHEYYSYKYHKP